MHNIDRISMESPFGYEAENGFGQYEGEYGQYQGEFGGQYENSYEQQYENTYEGEGEGEGEGDFEFGSTLYSESPFSEAQELALASELLNVTNEEELDQFIGTLIKGASKLLGTPLGKQLGGIIKGAAKSALPLLGAAAGNLLIPGAGGVMGTKLASAAGSLLGLEVEGLSREDQEYEIARQLVRFGGAAASNADEIEQAQGQTAPPQQAAQQAAVAAAQQYAPGLLRPDTDPNLQRPRRRRRCRHRRTGQWIRRGNKILILGV